VPSLREWIADTPEGMIGAPMDARDRSLAVIDLGYLLAARSHLAPPALATIDDGDTARHLRFAADLAALIGAGLLPDSRGDVDGTPDEAERSAFEVLARLTVQATIAEARLIWQPIVATGGPAHYWVENFLGDVWHAALEGERWPTQFSELVKEMLAFAKDADTWQGGRGSVDVALAVVGLDRWGHSRMQERHAGLVEELLPEWSEWVRARLRGSWFARHAVHFFKEAAASPARRDGITWLAERERSAAAPDSGLDEAVSELLLSVYTKEPELLRGPDEAAANARFLLARLAGRGVPLAVERSARLG
jgi:hypothetical protein